MQNKTAKIIFSIFAVTLLSGCSEKPAPETIKNKETSPLSDALDTTQKAKQNINQSTAQENTKLTQTLNQNNQSSMQYTEQYDGAILHTSKGDITFKFYNVDSPLTVNNFLKLASEKFYDGTRFHRVIKDFMIQGGDPNSKDEDRSNDGMGGPGYTFKDEFNQHSLVRGSLAMANAGPNTNGSQFFIVTAASTPWLDGKHTNFGEVTAGMEIVDAIENAATDNRDNPIESITIKSIDLIEKK